MSTVTVPPHRIALLTTVVPRRIEEGVNFLNCTQSSYLVAPGTGDSVSQILNTPHHIYVENREATSFRGEDGTRIWFLDPHAGTAEADAEWERKMKQACEESWAHGYSEGYEDGVDD